MVLRLRTSRDAAGGGGLLPPRARPSRVERGYKTTVVAGFLGEWIPQDLQYHIAVRTKLPDGIGPNPIAAVVVPFGRSDRHPKVLACVPL